MTDHEIMSLAGLKGSQCRPCLNKIQNPHCSPCIELDVSGTEWTRAIPACTFFMKGVHFSVVYNFGSSTSHHFSAYLVDLDFSVLTSVPSGLSVFGLQGRHGALPPTHPEWHAGRDLTESWLESEDSRCMMFAPGILLYWFQITCPYLIQIHCMSKYT